MSELILTHEQAKLIREARERVLVRDPEGHTLATIDPAEAATLDRHRAWKRGPRGAMIPAEKVADHLQALEEEWQRTGGFDREYLLGFLQKLRAEDAK